MTPIVVRVKLQDGVDEDSYHCELRHVQALKRKGVPMSSFLLFPGADSGKLSYLDDVDGFRTYTWEPSVTPCNSLARCGIFETKYQIHKFETLSEHWYQVKERPWYWPFWGYWSDNTYGKPIPVTFKTLEHARLAIQGRIHGNSGVRSILVDTHR